VTRTTKADLTALTIRVQLEARSIGILGPGESLILTPADKVTSRPYRLHTMAESGDSHPFTPADGNQGDIGRTAREAEHTLRIMWHTLRAARKAVGR
jgi:hypothetical protein